MNYFEMNEEDFQQSQIEPNLYSYDEYQIEHHHASKKIISTSLTQQMKSLKLNSSNSRRISKSKVNERLKKSQKNKDKKKLFTQIQGSQKEEAQYDLYTQEYKQIQVFSLKSMPSLY